MATPITSGVFNLGALGGDGAGTVFNYSLQFDGSADYLSRTVSASNRKTWTFSAWLKKADLTARDTLFSGGTAGDANNLFYVQLEDNTSPGATSYRDNNLKIVWREGSTATRNLTTTATFKNTTEWVHLVLALDTTQTAASDKMKLYIDGAEVTGFAVDDRSTIATNDNLPVNAAGSLALSAYAYALGSAERFKGQIAEVHFIDGQALDATYFGETLNSQWVPKEVTGVTYGTNGFHLDFEDASTAAALGNDATANGNDFTVTGLNTSDRLNDVPLAATTTRPTRRWGGMTGRSLVESGAAPTTASIDYLVVGGGGAGGVGQTGSYVEWGGGGGAGGYLTSRNGGTPLTFNDQDTFTVTVGAGGAGTNTVNATGGSGGSSVFATVTALGGGGGGGATAGSGGSGGGARTQNNAGGAGTAGQGNAGANSIQAYAGGGGGAGGAPTGTINGGVGAQNDITGTSIYYAGGGGGVIYHSTNPSGQGGLGGGGNAIQHNGTSHNASSVITIAQSGTDGLGGGGGGSSRYAAVNNGFSSGDGGSGVVILRVPTSVTFTQTTGNLNVPQAQSLGNGEHYYKFTSGSGTVRVDIATPSPLPKTGVLTLAEDYQRKL